MKVVAGYLRVSTTGQSVDLQKEEIEKVCKEKNWDLYRLYSDEGISGKKMQNRPAIQRLKQDARENKFECLVYTKLDRIGRNLRELLNFLYFMKDDLHLETFCINEPILNTTKGKMGDVIIALLGTFAQFEREMIQERMDEGRMAKWADGKAFIGSLPFGYVWDDVNKSIEIHPDISIIYHKIVNLYLDQNFSYRSVALQLTEEGIPPPSNSSRVYKKKAAKVWNETLIGNVLKNSAYKGEATYNKTDTNGEEKPEEKWITVQYPPLINESRWN